MAGVISTGSLPKTVEGGKMKKKTPKTKKNPLPHVKKTKKVAKGNVNY